MRHTWVIVCLVAVVFSACRKETAVNPTTQNPASDLAIELIEPPSEAMIPIGADTTLVVFISDALSLHEYTIRISNEQDSVLFYEEGHSHAPEITVRKRWTNTAAVSQKLRLHVQASNHKGDLLERTFFFYSK